jgi:hypothetical protein
MFSSPVLGENLTPKLVGLVAAHVDTSCRIWNLYGPAETFIATFHLVNPAFDTTSIPIGRPLPNYQCLILDEFSQAVVVGQEEELLVGGVGVFFGYLDREDLTTKALVEIDGQMFYRTGDLVRMDKQGGLHYVGRKDHQVKLRGQRIELGEIERCLLDTSISACVVIKWSEDHLIAYVQSSHIDVEILREHCQSRLPPFMVPSMFIVLEHFPLNTNGKLDRKRLPQPDFATFSTTSNKQQQTKPNGELESGIHSLWCELLRHSCISTSESIFIIGGHSLVLMQLYYRYKTEFNFDTRAVSITQLFQYPTIVDHARLIGQTMNKK